MAIINFRHMEALTTKKDNANSTWTGPVFNEVCKDETSAAYRISQDFFVPRIVPEFSFSQKDKVFSIGSCFARGLENALMGHGVNVASVTDAFDGYELVNVNVTPRGYMNKYNTYTIKYDINWGLEPDTYAEGSNLVEESEGKWFDFQTNPTIKPGDYELTLERRLKLNCVNRALSDCRLVTITLGMIEAWYDKEQDLYLNFAPSPRVLRKFPTRFEFRVTSYEENMANLEEIYQALAKGCGEETQIVVTVSPVPLMATFTSRDIVAANTFSKSMLRTAAETWAFMHDNVHYFPSYEMVMNSNPKRAWEKDRRHVRGEMAQHIMQVFTSHYMQG